MPHSSSQGKMFFEEWVSQFMACGQIGRILDVGAGSGAYGRLIRKVAPLVERWNPAITDLVLHACEPFEMFHEKYKLPEFYNEIFPVKIQEKLESMEEYDLIIFGDVLEHLEKEAAIEVFNRCKAKAKFVWVCLPIVALRDWSRPHNQEAREWQENILEKHLHLWAHEEVLADLGPFLWVVPFPTVAVYIAERTREKTP